MKCPRCGNNDAFGFTGWGTVLLILALLLIVPLVSELMVMLGVK